MKASDTSALLEVIKEQNRSIESLRKTIEELNSNSKILREQIDYLNRKLFGTKSEKTAALTGQIVSATVYTLVETAKANGLNPYKYLNVLLRALPKFSSHGKMDLIDSLMPLDPKIRKACSTTN